MNTGHMTTQFGLRPFFATNAAKVACGTFLFSVEEKSATVNQESLLRVYCMTRL